MKTGLSISLLIFTFALLSCSTSVNISEITNPKPPDKVLEITSDFKGLWWMNGEVLDFRLYDDGTVEFDEYQMQPIDGKIIKAEDVKTTKQIKINESEVKEILDILNSPEFSDLPKDIKPQRLCIDNTIDTKIIFVQNNLSRNVKINYHCTSLSNVNSTSGQFDNFPLKLNEFFQKILIIKNKKSGGKFYF